MRLLFILLCLGFTVVSCKKENAIDEGEIAYLGGEVINPRDNKVIISKSDVILDTIILDKKNRFLYKISNLESGLYAFKLQAYHGVEFQLALLEPNDSIMFRLNTMDFDESLVFTGKGAKKNNYLINMFLKNEEDNKNVLSYSQLEPIPFEKRLDSLRATRKNNLNQFLSKYETSLLFKEIAKANIDYNYYLSKEIYPFAFYGDYEIKNIHKLPDNFYSYRKDIDYNNIVLKDYFTYYRFLRLHFKNLALTEHLKHSKDSSFERNSFGYNYLKLKLIDSLVTNPSIKNPLLSMSTLSYINNNNNTKELDSLLNFYYAKSTDTKSKDYIKNLVFSLEQVKTGKKIPNVALVNANNKEVFLQKIIKKPTVIYFWSFENESHFKESHLKIKELKQKYPEVDFVSINMDTPNIYKNNNILKQYQFGLENEFQFKNPKTAKYALAINPIVKTILVNKKGVIAEAHTNIFSVYFEEQLLGLLNR